MSTRSVIARQEGDTWRGRFVHWDGYPESQVPILLALVKNLGAEAAIKFLTEEHYSWSSLNEDPKDCTAHDDASEDWWITADGDDCGTEWAYVLNHTGFTVLQRVTRDGSPASGYFGMSAADDGAWLIAGRFGYAAEPDEATLSRIECGAEFERCKHYAWKHFPEAKDTRYGTGQWLGREEPRFSDATRIEILGTRYKLTGSGGTSSSVHPRDYAAIMHRNAPAYWWSSVTTLDDEPRADVRVARIVKAGYKLDPGVALVFPPTAVRGELVVPAGTVIERG